MSAEPKNRDACNGWYIPLPKIPGTTLENRSYPCDDRGGCERPGCPAHEDEPSAIVKYDIPNDRKERHNQVENASKVAAAWWADRLRSGVGLGENGADDPQSVMAGGFVRLARLRYPIFEETCLRFEQLLTEKIIAEFGNERRLREDLDGFDFGGPLVELGVDYNPCPLLYDALVESGVSENMAGMMVLPWKTRMRVSRRRVLLRAGYGADEEEIYGPVWGCTKAQQVKVDSYRIDQMNDAWEAHEKQGYSKDTRPGYDWSGPVPESAH